MVQKERKKRRKERKKGRREGGEERENPLVKEPLVVIQLVPVFARHAN